MKSCPNCLNLSPDTAVACDQCGIVLDASVAARAAGFTGARMPTVVERSEPPRSLADRIEGRPSPPPPAPVAPSQPPGPSSPGRRGQTVFMPFNPSAGAEQSAAAPRTAERRIVGILITYSWAKEGQMFPVREGRNLIGRGEKCDIRVPEDSMLSEINSHITFRQTFVLGDMVSMSGTDLNDEPVEEQFRPLGNYARIRTGSTNWIFVIVDPALTSLS